MNGETTHEGSQDAEITRLKQELKEAKNTIVNVRKERGARVLELKKELKEARDVLETLEYSSRTAQDNLDMCPVCKCVPCWGELHREDCQLHKALTASQ